jgi:hypothetical protein
MNWVDSGLPCGGSRRDQEDRIALSRTTYGFRDGEAKGDVSWRALRMSATALIETAGALFPQLLRTYVATSVISWSVIFHAKLGIV